MKNTKLKFLLFAMCALILLFSTISCNDLDEPVKEVETESSCNHQFTSTIIREATCTENGLIQYICSTCCEIVESEISANGQHNYTIFTTPATCSIDGSETYTCTICGDTYTETIAAAGNHSYSEEVTANATCTTAGTKTFTCTICNYSYTEEIPSAGNHNYIETITTVATCTNDGAKTFTCSECNDSYTETIPATDAHNYVETIVTAATCTENGTKALTCSVCGTSFTETIYASGSHTLTSSNYNPATCTTDGSITNSCSKCSYTSVETIAAGHQWANATCTLPKVCSECDATEGNPLGHTTDEGTCSRCGTYIEKPVVSSICAMSFAGRQNLVTDLFQANAGNHVIRITYVGEKSNFIVRLCEKTGTEFDTKHTIVNETSSYSGEVTITLEANKNYYLEILSNGNWTIDLGYDDTLDHTTDNGTCSKCGAYISNPVSDSKQEDTVTTNTCTRNFVGSGNAVTGIFQVDAGTHVVRITHDGQWNFIVRVYVENGEGFEHYMSLANEIGPYNGEATINMEANKNYYLEILTSGNWTIDFGYGDPVTYYNS